MCSRTKRRSTQDQPVAGGRRSRAGTRMRFWIMLGLLKVVRMPKQISLQGTAIIDDRRAWGNRHSGGGRDGAEQRCGIAATVACERLDTLSSLRAAIVREARCATCVHDPGHCEPPDGRRGSSSVPGCGSRSQAVRGSLAGCIEEGEKNFSCVTTRRRNLWRSEQPGTRTWPAVGACVLCLGMLGSWQRRSGDVWPAAAPPASDELAAGIPAPGSSAGSSTAVGTCARTLCAGRSAGAVGALWPYDGALP